MSHLTPWLTGCEWYCLLLCKALTVSSCLIPSLAHRMWVTHCSVKPFTTCYPIVCEWHFCKQWHHITSYLLPTGSEWHYPFFFFQAALPQLPNRMWVILSLCRKVSSYEHSLWVTLLHILLLVSLIMLYPLTNRKWVTAYLSTSHFILSIIQMTESKQQWHWTFLLDNLITCYCTTLSL